VYLVVYTNHKNGGNHEIRKRQDGANPLLCRNPDKKAT